MFKQKENVNPKRKGKFDSCQNYRQNKFEVYTYQKNVLISPLNGLQNGQEQHDYITQNSGLENESKLEFFKNQKQKQQITQNVDNLCDLWEKLGDDNQNIDSEDIIQVNKQKSSKQQPKSSVQLTEQELLACFGQQSQQLATNFNQNILIEQKNKYNPLQEKDQDLMNIWNDNQNENTSNNIQNTSEKHQNKISQISIQENQSIHSSQSSKQLSDLELQDPNKIQITSIWSVSESRCLPIKKELQEIPLPKIQVKQQPQSLIASSTITQDQNNKKSQNQLIQQNDENKLKKDFQDQPKNYSIQNQILLQKNHKNMTKLIPGKDYQIFNTKLFSLSSFKPNTYSYFGIQTRLQSILDPKQNFFKNKQKIGHISGWKNVFYLHCFQTSEAYLQLKPQPFEKDYLKFLSIKRTITLAAGQKVTKNYIQHNTQICYKIRVCSTRQHIATLFLKVIKEGYLYDLRLYDEYQNTHSDPIALVEVKDGYANNCCYCDTNVFIQKKRNYLLPQQSEQQSSKAQSQIEKLKMILNMKNGKLTANMGINGIQSSPYNCCLENQGSKSFIYLLGLLAPNNIKQQQLNSKSQSLQSFPNARQIQNSAKNNQNKQILNDQKFIVKIGEGISPLLGLVISAGRKIYIDSFQ